MRLNKLPGYGLPELAFWPQPKYERNEWSIYCLKLRTDGTPACTDISSIEVQNTAHMVTTMRITKLRKKEHWS